MSNDNATQPPGTDEDGAVRALILLAAKLASADGPCQVPKPWPTTSVPALRVRVTPASVIRDRLVVVRDGFFAWAEAERRTIAPIDDVARATRVIEHVLDDPDLTPPPVRLPALVLRIGSDATQ